MNNKPSRCSDTFYGGEGHPKGGSIVATTHNGKIDYINPANADYLKSQSPKSLNKIKYSEGISGSATPDTTSHTGFSKSRVISGNEKSEREQQLERLVILQNTEARLLKDLERTRSVIKSIKSDLSI